MEESGGKKWMWWKNENEDENDGEGEVDWKELDREKILLHRKRLVFVGCLVVQRWEVVEW